MNIFRSGEPISWRGGSLSTTPHELSQYNGLPFEVSLQPSGRDQVFCFRLLFESSSFSSSISSSSSYTILVSSACWLACTTTCWNSWWSILACWTGIGDEQDHHVAILFLVASIVRKKEDTHACDLWYECCCLLTLLQLVRVRIATFYFFNFVSKVSLGFWNKKNSKMVMGVPLGYGTFDFWFLWHFRPYCMDDLDSSLWA